MALINVGIFTRKAIAFHFDEEYVHIETGAFLTGDQRALLVNGKIVFNGKLYDELFFEPSSSTATFRLKGVTIGIDFHWQREEDQCFRGALELVATSGGIVAINQVDVEDYLESVISSEMNGDAPGEFLKAHAVISRSWVLAQIEHRKAGQKNAHPNICREEDRLIRWYDKEDHVLFDVCADDHCQRYQGITRIENPGVQEAVRETRGEVLAYNGEICDARFSKCCGGVTERFETCWEPVAHPYLVSVGDNADGNCPDLSGEKEAEAWIRSTPDAFCHTDDAALLRHILNDYDTETQDFYRWKVFYTQEQLASLVCRKSGRNFGSIIDLVPLKRGSSGRIEELRIVGTRLAFTLGKELEIRRTLSETHLYSSAFVVDKGATGADGAPESFTLTGAGWGHGVGLCQIGAAVMAARGFSYKEILQHYFPGTQIDRE